MLSLPEIEAEVRRRAAAIGAPDAALPTFGRSDENGRPHVEVDGRGYHYVIAERGRELQRVTTTELDELLYLTFHGAAHAMGTAFAASHQMAGQDYRRPLFKRQVDLLAMLSPQWAERAAQDQARTLAAHPYVDSTSPPAAEYSILPTAHDVLVYAEGQGRTIDFSCSWAVEPPQASVPAAGRWAEQVPAWASERRGVIIDRLRAAGCVLFEVGAGVTTVRAPDGSCRVESSADRDERGAHILSTRLVGPPGDVVLLHVGDVEAIAPIRFVAPALIDLPVRHASGAMLALRLDLAARTFRLPPTGDPQPWDALPAALRAATTPSAPVAAPAWPSPSKLFGPLAFAAMGLTFVAGGAFLMLTGKTAHDRVAGGVGVVFFGLCTVPAARTLRQWRADLLARAADRRGHAPLPLWVRLVPYVPLALLVAEIPWCVVVFLGVLFVVGDQPFTSTPAKERFVQVLMGLPAVAGLPLGGLIVAGGVSRTLAQRICLWLGLRGCLAFVAASARTLLR